MELKLVEEMEPTSTGAIPVITCPLIFVWIGIGISPKSITEPFLSGLKKVKSICSLLKFKMYTLAQYKFLEY